MKRIKAACLEQIIHFQLKEDMQHDLAVKTVREEYENYKHRLEATRTEYKILEEQILPDQSIQIRIRKQYNTYPAGDLLD